MASLNKIVKIKYYEPEVCDGTKPHLLCSEEAVGIDYELYVALKKRMNKIYRIWPR
jgi:hypothetical protein